MNDSMTDKVTTLRLSRRHAKLYSDTYYNIIVNTVGSQLFEHVGTKGCLDK